MVANVNSIAVRRDQKIFVVPETTKGTLVFPAAGDAVFPAGWATINQNPSFTDSEEIQNTRDITDRFVNSLPTGEWNIPVYCRPSGTAGTAPQEDELLEAYFGTETVTGGTSVAYSQAIDKPSVSIWILKDHTVRFAAGATVSDLGFSLSRDGALMFNFSGKCMTTGVVGTQDIANAAIVSTDTTVEVDDASCYSVGGKIEFYDVSAETVDDNTSAGYEITAVNTTTNVITFTPGVGAGFDIDDIVRPFLPTPAEVGDPLENRLTAVTINSVATNVKRFDLNASDPVVYTEDEITASGNVEDYIPGRRNITGSWSSYFRKNDAKYFTDNLTGVNDPISVAIGDTAGSILTISMPYCSIDTPRDSDSSPSVSIEFNFQAIGSSGEDSLTFTYT